VLVELRVRDLGVIADLDLVLGPGMTAVTGETGAGKTLVVEAVELLVGGRAEMVMVRRGSSEAVVEGRFVEEDGVEVVLARSVSSSGRPKASVDGRMAPVATLGERGRRLVDLHGQHAHQSLLAQEGQRAALDRYAGVDLSEVERLEARLAALGGSLDALGGDERERLRNIDLLQYQLGEIEQAAVSSDGEEEELVAEEERLAGASALRAAAEEAYGLISGDVAHGGAGALDMVGSARAATGRHRPLDAIALRIAAVAAELEDVASELRHLGESFEEDPERLRAVGERRRQLADLRRKYGETLADVRRFATAAQEQLALLASAAEQRELLAAEREAAQEELAVAEEKVGEMRRAAAAALAAELEDRLSGLAMPGARIAVEVGPGRRGDDVQFLLGANAGEAMLPLQKVASGGELARAMLALRLVLTAAPPTLVFDEVDAGIGGEAAVAVGRALAEIGERHQVLVVTHLAQVAAFADRQVAVRKRSEGGRTVATVEPVEGEERLAELARMLSGRSDSTSGRAHAAELLQESARRAGGSGSVGDNPLRRKP
jgi:DNA repair protein RecN (Recombination protein N)